MRRPVVIALLAAGTAWLPAAAARAQILSVSGNPAALNIVAAVPGSQPTPVTNVATSYTVTTALQKMKITAKINSAMPSGLTLQITLAAPAGGTSQGAVTLSTLAQNAVTGIPALTVLANRGITYAFSATVAAGVVASTTRTVTLTLLADP